MPGRVAMLRWTMIGLLASVAACAERTPTYGIFYGDDGDGPAVRLNAVNPNDIDAAFAIAAELAGVDAKHAAAAGVILELHEGAINWESALYAGTTEGTITRVTWYPCLFDPRSALVHEFLHVAFDVATGDMDAAHANPAWKQVSSRQLAMMPRCSSR